MIKILLLLLITASSFILPSSYYIDSENGNDTNPGTSAQQAWQTIAKAGSISFQPGDIIYLKRGSLWREQLTIPSSGIVNNNITFTSYGEGELPVISGADIIKDFINVSPNIWYADAPVLAWQVFVDQARGAKKDSLFKLTSENDWFYSYPEKRLYIYKITDPAQSFIEISVRPNCILVSGNNITLHALQAEKSYHSAVEVAQLAQNNVVDGLQLLQWASVFDISNAGVYSAGINTEIKNCVFGKNTGNELQDQQWSGANAIRVTAGNASIHNNYIYHTSTENENAFGVSAHGIYVSSFRGVLRIHDNYIYHTGSHGIRISGYSFQGDSVFIYNNVIEYPGQAGILAYKTRAGDGIGGAGYVYGNNVSYANRLGGDIGSGGTQSCGIHMNDGVIQYTEPGKPFIKWKIFENIVHHCESIADPGSEDSGGIIADYNSHGTEIYRNLLYNNFGKGISVWNANNTKVYYNIVYGNDAGIVVSAASGTKESADNNEVYNNTLFKNYNGMDRGTNLNAEIYFGKNGKNNIFRNNILYAADEGYACRFENLNTSGNLIDNSLMYKDLDDVTCYDRINKKQNFAQWRINHPEWDKNSIHSFPDIVFVEGEIVVNKTSPAIDKAYYLGQTEDFHGNEIVGNPDIGAVEYNPVSGVEDNVIPGEFSLSQNYPNPFNPETNIKFTLGNSGHVIIKVFDILGSEVETLLNRDMEAGIQNIVFKSNSLAGGIYFYTLYFEGKTNFSQTKKMVLLK